MSLWKLYDLDGTEYTNEDVVELFIEALNEFKQENPSFIGSKFIFGGNKQETPETIANYFQIIQRLRRKYPQFVAGFDLSNLEDKSPRLITFAKQILELPKDIQLFFHAGETKWFGSTDENLVRMFSMELFVFFTFSFQFFSFYVIFCNFSVIFCRIIFVIFRQFYTFLVIFYHSFFFLPSSIQTVNPPFHQFLQIEPKIKLNQFFSFVTIKLYFFCP